MLNSVGVMVETDTKINENMSHVQCSVLICLTLDTFIIELDGVR